MRISYSYNNDEIKSRMPRHSASEDDGKLMKHQAKKAAVADDATTVTAIEAAAGDDADKAATARRSKRSGKRRTDSNSTKDMRERGRTSSSGSAAGGPAFSRQRSRSLDSHDRYSKSKNNNKSDNNNTNLLPVRPSISKMRERPEFISNRSLMRRGKSIPRNLIASATGGSGLAGINHRTALLLNQQRNSVVLSQVVVEDALTEVRRKDYEKRKSIAQVGLKDMFASLDFDEMEEDDADSAERNAAAKCIQRFFKHSMFVLAEHHDEIKYWQMEIRDVQRRRTMELADIARIKELEKQRIEVDLHIEFGLKYDKTGLEWGTYHKWTKEQMTKIDKERDEAESLKESIRLLTYDNVHATREIHLLEDKERHLKVEVKAMEQEKEKWLGIVKRLENAISKAQEELQSEQDKIQKQEQQIKSLKDGIDKAVGMAFTTPTTTQTPTVVAVSPDSKQVGVVTAESTAAAAAAAVPVKIRQRKEGSLRKSVFAFSDVAEVVITKGCDKETAARCIQRFFRRAMVALDYCYDEIAYWEAERDCCKRRQQEEMLAIQDQLEMEKKEALLELNHELELEGDTKEEEQQDAHLDFDAFSDEIFELKRKIKKAKKEKQKLEKDVQSLIKENRQLDQSNVEQMHKNRTAQEKVKLLETKRDETKDIGLGCEAAIDILSKEIIETVNQRMDRNAAVENRAAYCIQRFFKQVVAVVDAHKEDIAYWEDEKRDVERRRLEELDAVKEFIKMEKQQLELEFMSENQQSSENDTDKQQKFDWDGFCNETKSLKKEVKKEKKRREKLLGDIRFLQYKNKQIEQATKVQNEMIQNVKKEVEKSESNKSMLEAGIEKCEQGEETLEVKLAKAKKKKKVERAWKNICGKYIVKVVDLVKARGSETTKGAKLLKNIRKIQSNVMEVPKEKEETKADKFKKLISEGTLSTCDMSDGSSCDYESEDDEEGDKFMELKNDTALWRVILDRRTDELPPPTTNKTSNGKKKPPRRVLSNKNGRTGSCLWRQIMEGQKQTNAYAKQFERVKAEATGKNKTDSSTGRAPRRGRRGGRMSNGASSRILQLRRNDSRSLSPEQRPRRKTGRMLRQKSKSLPASEMRQLLKNISFEEAQDKDKECFYSWGKHKSVSGQ